MPDREKLMTTLQYRINEARNKGSKVTTIFISTLSDCMTLLKEQDAEISRISNAYLELVGKASKQPKVVRCKDCKHFHEFEPSEFCKMMFHDETRYECWNPRLTDQDNVPTKGPDWFCADGERK